MRAVLIAVLLFAAMPALAQEVSVGPSDNILTVLNKQKGKRVTVRLASGQELTGMVRETTSRLVVLGAITGREFFDAVVPVESVEAVLIRTK